MDVRFSTVTALKDLREHSGHCSFLLIEGKWWKRTWWPARLCPRAECRLFRLECGWCQDNVAHQTLDTASCRSCPEIFLHDAPPSAFPKMNKYHSLMLKKNIVCVIGALTQSCWVGEVYKGLVWTVIKYRWTAIWGIRVSFSELFIDHHFLNKT